MEFFLQPGTPPHLLQTQCRDIPEGEDADTTLTFHHGEYQFDLTIHKRFVPSDSHNSEAIPPLELPRPAVQAFPTMTSVEAMFVGERQPSDLSRAPYGSAIGVPIPLEDNSSMAEAGTSTIFDSNPYKSGGPAPNTRTCSEQQAATPGTLLFGNFNERIPEDNFEGSGLGQNAHISARLAEIIDFPTFYQGTPFLSHDFNYFDGPAIELDSSDIGPYANQLNYSDNTQDNSQESSFSSAWPSTSSNLTSMTPSSTAATSPLIDSSSTDGHVCSHCHKRFGRQSDLKRHVGRHFPDQWEFHCKQPDCDRRGLKGFYRRDKLKTHERQVHGLDT